MMNARRWVLVLCLAAAGVIGGAGGVDAAATGSQIASHEQDDQGPDPKGDETTKGDDDKGKSGGDSSDKADDDGSDAGDTDGPGDDEDD